MSLIFCHSVPTSFLHCFANNGHFWTLKCWRDVGRPSMGKNSTRGHSSTYRSLSELRLFSVSLQPRDRKSLHKPTRKHSSAAGNLFGKVTSFLQP
uniref:Uncharacterized protein n=1 Tax=Rhizophora mucronata TaxID=61149 RepID=A0A2P2PLF7_RHIMU